METHDGVMETPAAAGLPRGPWRSPVGPNTHHTTLASPLGELTLVCDGAALTGVYMAAHKHTDRTGWGELTAVGDPSTPPVLAEAAHQLSAYFAGDLTEFEVPMAPRGTAFQRLVWARLLDIPYGETRSYGQLATIVGNTGASRAVGLANGRNPISIVVPCHRVVGSTGQLTGYGGGIERKRTLLALEERVSGRSLW